MTADRLQQMWDAQRKLQVELGNVIAEMDPDEWADYVRTMAFACSDELHEAVRETGWKPWGTSRHLNVDKFKDEMTDAFLFFMNLAMAGGMTAADLFERYAEKRDNAQRRFYEGYAGVSTSA